ncbi:MAG TPA: hypothetical protein VFE98_02365 [Candidatus Bathyarchaeia archaeon]|nr:hypothetical protein [Candidatus Bathyarchaeia archaeon]
METISNHSCPRCGRERLNVYYSEEADNKIGAWCGHCNLKAYYFGEELVPLKQ